MRTRECERYPGDKMVRIFLKVLNSLGSQKPGAQQHGRDKKCHSAMSFAQLRTANSQGHCQATGQQHARIERSEDDIEMPARGFKCCRMNGSIDGVAGEQAAKEHDFRHQKNPHPQHGRLLLLRGVVKLMRDHGWGISHCPCPHNCTGPRSLRVSPKSCQWAAAKTSATPSRWRATDLAPQSGHSVATKSGRAMAADSRGRESWPRRKT